MKNSKGKELRLPLPLTVEADEDIKAVLAFMSENFEATKLVEIARAVSEIAIPLWGRHNSKNPFVSLFLRAIEEKGD
jgi:hypothetical protein